MLRWLVRLLVLAGIAVAGAILVSRLTNREEDFEDYDDLEAGFDFQETPVEIEVPAEQSAPRGSGSGGNGVFGGGGSADGEGEGGEAAETMTAGGEHLTDISGIGPAYDARLKAMGISNLMDLSQADANSLNEQLDVIGGVATIEDWIAQAKSLTSESATGNGQ